MFALLMPFVKALIFWPLTLMNALTARSAFQSVQLAQFILKKMFQPTSSI